MFLGLYFEVVFIYIEGVWGLFWRCFLIFWYLFLGFIFLEDWDIGVLGLSSGVYLEEGMLGVKVCCEVMLVVGRRLSVF